MKYLLFYLKWALMKTIRPLKSRGEEMQKRKLKEQLTAELTKSEKSCKHLQRSIRDKDRDLADLKKEKNDE